MAERGMRLRVESVADLISVLLFDEHLPLENSMGPFMEIVTHEKRSSV
jgi:hypothetical protein